MSQPDEPPPTTDADDEPLHIGAGFDFSDPNSPLAFLYLRTGGVVAIGFFVLVFLFFGVTTQLSPTDIWGHLKYGQWIVQNRALPEHELFSPFADHDQPYWNLQWLSQAVFYLTYHAGALLAGGDELRQTQGGVEMLRTLHGLLIALRTMFIFLAMRRATRSTPLALAACVLSVFMTMPSSRIARPQIFGELFFAMLLWWVSGPRLGSWSWLALPLLFTAWANCHGSFLIGFVLLGAVCVGRFVETTVAQGWRSGWKNSWLLYGMSGLVLALLAVTFLNPHGPSIYTGVFAISRHPNIRTIVEWSPLDFSQPMGPHWLYLASVIVLAVSQALSPRPLALSRVLVLIPFALGPLYQQRMIVWWLIVMPWLAADLWHYTAAAMRGYLPRLASVASLRKTMMAAALVLIGVVQSGVFQLLIGNEPMPLTTTTARATLWDLALPPKHGPDQQAFQKTLDAYPQYSLQRLAKFNEALKSYPSQTFQGKIFAQDLLADYLLWSLPEPAPILVYNHAHVFPAPIWRQQVTVMSGSPGWESILARYQVNLVVVDAAMCHQLADKLRRDPEWHMVVDDGGAAAATPDVYTARLLIALRKRPL